MSLREALKVDFEIDVRIEGGEGIRNEPFVVESPYAKDAARTQLGPLRGLGRGRTERWLRSKSS